MDQPYSPGRPWTDEEVALLRQLWQTTHPLTVLEERLTRSQYRIREKARALGLGRRPVLGIAGNPWGTPGPEPARPPAAPPAPPPYPTPDDLAHMQRRLFAQEAIIHQMAIMLAVGEGRVAAPDARRALGWSDAQYEERLAVVAEGGRRHVVKALATDMRLRRRA